MLSCHVVTVTQLLLLIFSPINSAQVRKLGLLTPDEELPVGVRQVFNQLWANNGDAISRQYAGTAAMKGDYTRTGERKFSGLMKDGVKSASRLVNQVYA